MNSKMFNNSFNKNRIQTPTENKFPIENNIISDKKAKSTKKFNANKKHKPILFNNNINSINIINNNYNNIYLDTNKPTSNKNIVLQDKNNLGLLTFGNVKEKSLKKNKALKLIFNQSNREKEKFNENKYQYIIDRLKYEIDYYKNKDKVKSNQIGANTPHSYRKKGFKKNLFLASNKYNTIKSGKSSFGNLQNYKLRLNTKSPLSLKKNVKDINNILKGMNYDKNSEENLIKGNYKDKFEILKNRMNRLIGNLFDIIDLQQNKLNEFNNK